MTAPAAPLAPLAATTSVGWMAYIIAIDPSETRALVAVVAGVVLGIAVRRTMSPTVGEAKLPWGVEGVVLCAASLIATILCRGAELSGLAAVALSAAISAGGRPLIVEYFRQRAGQAGQGPMQPSAPTTIVNSGVVVPPPGHDPDQDLIDELKDKP